MTTSERRARLSSASPAAARRGEAGFSLAALLGVMAVLAIIMTTAAPNLRQQAQREKEIEAIFRGEQVAQAILLYMRTHGGALPTEMKQLIEGVPQGVKKVQILRPSAMRDPLTAKGEWKLVPPNDPALLEFQQALTLYAGGTLPPQRDPLLLKYATQITGSVNLGTQATSTPLTSLPMSSGPFIGVMSRSTQPAVLTYYGLERHERWIFTPLFR